MSALRATGEISDNHAAFLDMLAWSEIGPRMLADPRTDNGYKVIVGSVPGALNLFESYASHPAQRIWLPKLGIYSTAAGRYQLLNRYYLAYAKLLRLSDFSPRSQDLIALQQIKEQRAFALIAEGKVVDAMRRCANIWASLPGAGYGQHENALPGLIAAYKNAGGKL